AIRELEAGQAPTAAVLHAVESAHRQPLTSPARLDAEKLGSLAHGVGGGDEHRALGGGAQERILAAPRRRRQVQVPALQRVALGGGQARRRIGSVALAEDSRHRLGHDLTEQLGGLGDAELMQRRSGYGHYWPPDSNIARR